MRKSSPSASGNCRAFSSRVSGALDYYSEYIEEARFPDRDYKAAFRDFLRLKYQNVRFDAVIAVQEPALELVSGARQRAVSWRANHLLCVVGRRRATSKTRLASSPS